VDFSQLGKRIHRIGYQLHQHVSIFWNFPTTRRRAPYVISYVMLYPVTQVLNSHNICHRTRMLEW